MRASSTFFASYRFGLGLLLAGGLAAAACGGRAEDTTVIEPSPAQQPSGGDEANGVDDDEFDLSESRTLAELAEPETLDAFCGWVGATAGDLSAAGGPELSCEQVVGQCRDAATAAVDLDAGEGLPEGLLGLPEDLEEALGCAVTTTEVDACLAELLDLVVELYPDGPGCGEAAVEPPAIGFAEIVSLESCVGLVVTCPQLLQQLLDAGG